MRIAWITILLFSLITPASVVGASELSSMQKAHLREAATTAIQQRVVNGKFHYFDSGKGAIMTLNAKSFRPMIMHIGKHYVLCANLRNDDGKHVAIDLYVVQTGGTFVVVDTLVGKRAALKSLMKIGAATPAE